MLSISLGPLPLPVLPWVLMLSAWSAAALARRWSGPIASAILDR